MTKEFFEKGKKIAKWENNNMKQHKWCKEICAWANGEEVEFTYEGYEHFWEPMPNVNERQYDDYDKINWQQPTAIFRIKPQPVEPQDLSSKSYLYVYQDVGELLFVPEDTVVDNMEYIGKIPLIVESNDDL